MLLVVLLWISNIVEDWLGILSVFFGRVTKKWNIFSLFRRTRV